MARKYTRIYVGVKMDNTRVPFRAFNPSIVTHPEYRFIIGPFRTKLAADTVVENGLLTTVNAVERQVKALAS